MLPFKHPAGRLFNLLNLNTIMKVTHLLFSGLLILGGLPSLAQTKTIKQTYAPDSRVALFDVHFDGQVAKGITTIPEAKKAFLDSLQQSNTAYKEAIRVLPDDIIGEKKRGIVTISVANIRSKPQESAELASQALLGMEVLILDKERGWLLVQTPDHYIGWTDELGIVRMTEEEFRTYQQKEKYVYSEGYGFAYSEPTTKSLPVSDVTWGNVFEGAGIQKKGFRQIRYPDGRLAWVQSQFLTNHSGWKPAEKADAVALEKQAKQMMGIPYLWGGTSWKGVDCSGFTRMIYLSQGILLPRDASQQVVEGQLIATSTKELSKLEKGDLLFFGRVTPEGQEKVTHVGMWLGDNQFIHSSGFVRIASMDARSPLYDAFNYNRFLRAKRILPSL